MDVTSHFHSSLNRQLHRSRVTVLFRYATPFKERRLHWSFSVLWFTEQWSQQNKQLFQSGRWCLWLFFQTAMVAALMVGVVYGGDLGGHEILSGHGGDLGGHGGNLHGEGYEEVRWSCSRPTPHKLRVKTTISPVLILIWRCFHLYSLAIRPATLQVRLQSQWGMGTAAPRRASRRTWQCCGKLRFYWCARNLPPGENSSLIFFRFSILGCLSTGRSRFTYVWICVLCVSGELHRRQVRFPRSGQDQWTRNIIFEPRRYPHRELSR